MKLFRPLYERAITWAGHPRAPLILAALSFFEAFIFPVMPEVMLAPMCLANPRRGFRYAGISLLGSLFGAIVGYLLGHYAYAWMKPVFDWLGWSDGIHTWVERLTVMVRDSPWKAFWALVAAGFLPVPLKVFTWASGVVGMPLLPFLCGMGIGRGKRVFAVALAIRLGGERAERALHRHVETIGWAVLVLLAALVAWLFLRPGH